MIKESGGYINASSVLGCYSRSDLNGCKGFDLEENNEIRFRDYCKYGSKICKLFIHIINI